jgi:DNA-binding winged helix-turn-helix (wHTH) protein/ATP/maltotriose-dependent transcriptional regulator MalT
MSISFGRFVLDESTRALCLDGQERPLQPLVFDLLVYLVRHRERVVAKDELLTQLWSGAIVTDGSLQRAVSLLRATLREGSMDQAVQTFARRGYRFCEVPETTGTAVARGTALDGRRLIEQGQWQAAVDAFAAADQASFSLEDWEAWGNAALCAGMPDTSVAPFEHAVAAFEEAGERESAARVALILTNVQLEARELAIAQGWHRRALGYLKGEPEGKQHGMAVWLAGRLALFQGELEQCGELARQALEIAERLRDPDLRVLALIYQGHILVAQGEVRRGLSLHDEAGAAALAGRASLWVSGIVFCSVIWVYLHLGDHHRAGQWTDQFERWCERHGSYCYPALCRLHRSEILAVRGELASAEVEACRAREQLMVVGRYAEGDACRVLGEIRLARGDLDGAESAFRDAHRLGWNPQPGLGLLLAERGDLKNAIKQLERALAQPTWSDGQRRGVTLAVLARIAATDGQLERAATAIRELDGAPERTESHVGAAELAHARGELAWAQKELSRAEQHLRDGVTHWIEVGAPVHAARLRLRLSELLLDAGDPMAAELELSAAEAAFRHVHAEALLSRCQTLRSTRLNRPAHSVPA